MPRSVWWFEKLMWVSLLVGVAKGVLDWDRMVLEAVRQGANAHIPAYYLRTQIQAMSHVMVVIAVVALLVLVLIVWLIARQRKNWARWIFAVLFVLGVPFAFVQLPNVLSANPTAGALSLVQLVLQVAALVLIFLPDARPWFTRPAAGAQVNVNP